MLAKTFAVFFTTVCAASAQLSLPPLSTDGAGNFLSTVISDGQSIVSKIRPAATSAASHVRSGASDARSDVSSVAGRMPDPTSDANPILGDISRGISLAHSVVTNGAGGVVSYYSDATKNAPGIFSTFTSDVHSVISNGPGQISTIRSEVTGVVGRVKSGVSQGVSNASVLNSDLNEAPAPVSMVMPQFPVLVAWTIVIISALSGAALVVL